MIQFRTLSDTTSTEFRDCFNHAFSDYSVPFQLTLEQVESNFKTYSTNMALSVGAFRDDNLVGFVLHGSRVVDGKKVAYNGGTGVIPEERGAALTTRMYDYILPTLRAENYDKVNLEVFTTNTPAIKSYKKIGYVPVRNLDCFSGELSIDTINENIRIEDHGRLKVENLSALGTVQPTWQCATTSISNLGEKARQVLAYAGEELVGYCILNVGRNRIVQIAVKQEHRNKKIGSTILDFVKRNITNELSIINVDASAETTIKFLEKRNLKKTISQIDMVLKL